MPGEKLQLRDSYGRPSHQDGGRHLPADSSHKARFRHPGYDDNSNILMILPGLDHPQGGIHHETVRIACAMLANNRWDGFFTKTRTGARVELEPDGILHEKDYYFRVSEDPAEEKYPIVPSFAHWRFPHENLPGSWDTFDLSKLPTDRQWSRQSSLTEALLARDISCRITNHIEGTEHAHLVPRNEERWFCENGMFRYTNQQRPGTEPIHDSRNAILLRSDVHTVFDQKRFVLVPKASAFAVHVLAPGFSSELSSLYHNVTLQPLAGIAVEYLLARFAWTIFTHAVNFLQQGIGRRLVVCEEVGETRIADFSGDRCKQFSIAQSSKSRSQSPRKRQRDISSKPAEEEEIHTRDEEEASRGRRLKRSFESFTSISSSHCDQSTEEESSWDADVDSEDENSDHCKHATALPRRLHTIDTCD